VRYVSTKQIIPGDVIGILGQVSVVVAKLESKFDTFYGWEFTVIRESELQKFIFSDEFYAQLISAKPKKKS
jgi:hypothetical protein